MGLCDSFVREERLLGSSFLDISPVESPCERVQPGPCEAFHTFLAGVRKEVPERWPISGPEPQVPDVDWVLGFRGSGLN